MRRKRVMSRGIIAGIITAVIVMAVYFAVSVYNSPKSSAVGGSYTFNTAADFIAYANGIDALHPYDPDDTIELSLSSGIAFDLTSGFNGLGTSSEPFNGKIVIADNAIDTFMINTALFNYVTTDARIVNASDADRSITIIRSAEVSDKAVFAQHVVEGSTNSGTDWKVTFSEDYITDATNHDVYDFSGVIGDIADNCKVGVTFTNNSLNTADNSYRANVTGSGNLGLICGTLGESAVLTVNGISGNNTNFNITSSGGHAGGLVGSMGDGSTIKLGDNFTSIANVTASGSDKYAGGLAGYAVNAEIDYNGNTATVTKTLRGGSSAGAGGLFGYYSSTTDNGTGADAGKRVFDLSSFLSDGSFIIASGRDAGGAIGKLEATNDVVVTSGETFSASDSSGSKSSFDRKVQLNGGTNRGGLIGTYVNSSLSNSIEVKDIRVYATTNAAASGERFIGGIIGKNYNTSVGNYINIHDVAVRNGGSNAFSGGLVGDMGEYGSFLDVSGKIAATGNLNAGLVGYQRSGVVRIAGYSDFGGGYFGTAAGITEGNGAYGQLVGVRGNGLVYALGTGEDTLSGEVSSGWTFRRSGRKADDIGDWGEVLRVTPATESNYFTVDGSAHTVTVKAPVTSMGSVTDFVKTALNVQHNVSGQPATGSLLFADSSNTSTVLLGSNLSITNDIDLADTGIVALTRDNASNAEFTGTLEGNNHTISLAIGETYGLTSSGGAVSNGNNGYGTIIRHRFQGLIAKTNGATIQNLTIDGYNSTTASGGGDYATYIGGIVASSNGSLTLTNVTTQQTNNIYATAYTKCGGAVGQLENTSTGTISITGSTFKTIINDERASDDSNKYFGGVIGYVDSTNSLTFNFSGDTLDGTYSKTNTRGGRIYYGGLIGVFASTTTTASNNNRNVNITNLTVGEHVNISACDKSSNGRGGGAGAFIGSVWPNVNVTIGTAGSSNGITIGGNSDGSSEPEINVLSGSTNGNVGALFYKATGKMLVNHIDVVEAAINTNYGSSTFGFIVNDGYNNESNKVSALYLNVDSAKYDIAATTFSGNFNTAFDEIVAYSMKEGTNIYDNGQAVISITLPSNAAVVMSGSACNTYQNQTSYSKKINSNTRYYYNLESIRTKASPTPAEKLLMWSVNKYGHSSVKGLFANGFTSTISGNCDMEGLSYYPVDASGMTISAGTTIKFYNKEIEDGESATGDTDSSARSTRDSGSTMTQHYLMHEAIFRNYTGNLTVNGLTVKGNVSNANGRSGFIVRNMLGNKDDSTTTATLRNIVLDGAYVDGTGYAPMLINNIGKNTSMSINGLTASNYTSALQRNAASSLIGDVGYDTATNISLNFSNIVLDARTASLADGSADTALNTAYGTTRSIFRRATFLNSFAFLSGGVGIYNYNHDEDWDAPLHQVTYGKEITTSTEYANKQKHYYDDDTDFTSPVSGSAGSEFDFSSGFLPHVYNGAELGLTNPHEIRVNVREATLTTGCGQYNDPYIIENGGQLVTAASIISGVEIDDIEITLPSDLGTDANVMWHDASTETDRVYTYKTVGGTKKFYSGASNEYSFTLEQVRVYLTGAYYSLNNPVTLPSGFVGFGAIKTGGWTTTNYECQYAFRGVIVGNGNAIRNESGVPLIYSANGCVVKDLTVAVASPVSISQSLLHSNLTAFNYDNTGCGAYGGVIGRVMGGDNIISEVGVDYDDSEFSLSVTGTYERLVPVGGYVGVVVSGGVIFRDMGSVAKRTGLTSTHYAKVDDSGYLYVNPIIGRIIAGYAFTEASAYHYDDSSATMINGTKSSGGIPDLYPGSASKLTVTASSAANHTITIPDAQAFYILSCIVDSGAGSAAWNASTEQNYASISNAPWIAYRNYTSTRCAAYDEVGTSAALSGDYAKVAEGDKYSGSAKIPYIIRQYTTKDGSTYKARSICGNGSNAAVGTINLASGTTYEMANGYSGIGSLYVDNNAFKLRFNKFDGKGSTINLRMKHVEYNHESGNQNSKTNTMIDNYIPYTDSGFGLFNSMWQMSASATNCIKDVIFSGNVFTDIIKLSNGSNIKYAYGWHNWNNLTGYYPDVADRVEATNILHTGALAGLNGNSTYLNNVTIDAIDVEGAKYSGGLIGYAKAQNISIISPVVSSLKVTAGFCSGGLIGGFYDSADLVVKGTAENPVTIYVNSIKVKGEPSCAKLATAENNQIFNRIYHAGGGICGHLVTGTSKKATVEYVTVTGGVMTAPNRTKRPHDLRYKIAMGGLFGLARDSKIDVHDCSVTNITIDGNLCAGLIGYFDGNIKGVVDSVTVSGLTITSENIAGGLIAFIWASSSPEFTVSNSSVVNCSVSQVNAEAERACSGGVFGYVYIQKWTNGTSYFDIYDIKLDTCSVLRSNTVNTTDLAQCGVGGIYGVLRSDAGVSTGHNILLDKVTISTAGNRVPGMIIGTNTSNSQLKLVGVSLQNGSAATVKPVGVFVANNGRYGTNGYVVYADYFGASVPNTGQTQNTTDSSLNGDTDMLSGVTDYTAVSPYVTINNSLDIADGTMKLTSDGMADTVAHLAGKNIYDANAALPYDISRTVRPTFAPFVSKLSTYNTEQAASLANDFAVLVLDDIKKLNSTAMINSYLQMVTNTDFDYATDNNSIYKVVLKRMNLENDTFTVDTVNACNLKRSASRFYMNANDVDTAGQMFSLIDIQYLDPRDTTKVAYHLYVPVIVKKILKYNFEIATGSGTNYERYWYDAQNRWGQPVMENAGTPVSILFKYSYLRSQSEWQNAIENGENLLRNYDKSIIMTKPDSIGHIRNNTILVLVDRNNNDKPYYARFSDVYNSSTGVLNLQGFKEELDNSSSASFTPGDLNQLLDITASTSGSGAEFITCAEGSATVKAMLNGVETYFKPKDEGDEGTSYYLTVNNTNDLSGNVPMEESYYISFFTQAEDSAVVYHYTFSGPTSFNDTSFPSRINNLNDPNGSAHMILGNIFEQSNLAVAATNRNEAMSTSNDTLTVTMSADVAIRAALKSEVQGYLNGTNSSISVYQNFLIYLTRKDYDNPAGSKIIQGNPIASGTYTISSANGNVAAVSTTSYGDVDVTHNYADYINSEDIRLFLTTGNGAHIEATLLLNYPDELSIMDQFPGKTNESDTGVGVMVSGSSNVAFNPHNCAFSKIKVLANDSYDRLYYSKESNRAMLTYFAKDGEYGDYGQLGINPWELTDENEVTIDTIGVLDVSSIRDEAADFDTLVCKVKLQCRQNNYGSDLVISDFISNMWLDGVSNVTSTTTAGLTEYTFEVPKANVVDSSNADRYNIPLNYTVKTAELLEAGNTKYYSNYKVILSVELVKSSNDAILNSSQCSEYIVYTNAKVYPDFIDE